MTFTAPSLSWPADFPVGVPPRDAVPARGTAFRLVKSIPPTADDFLATIVEHPNPSRQYEGDDLVNAHAASFHTDLEASKRTRKRYKGLRERRIASGVLVAEFGVQKPTYGPGHLSVWLYEQARPHPSFVKDAEV